MKPNQKHTPGPWESKPHNSGFGIVSEHLGIAHIFTSHRACWADPKEAEANARLIAAAPELLKERDALRASHDRLLRACKKLVSIVPDSVEYGDWPKLQTAVDKADTAIAKAEKLNATNQAAKAARTIVNVDIEGGTLDYGKTTDAEHNAT